jgi:hypothetical protein
MALTVPGVDYAWGGKPYDDFKRAGVKFACATSATTPARI